VKDNQNFKIRDDLSVFIHHVFESLFIEIISSFKSFIIGVIYRPNISSFKSSIIGVIYRPNTASKANVDIFLSTLEHKHMSFLYGKR
jgi:hypothetical protein